MSRASRQHADEVLRAIKLPVTSELITKQPEDVEQDEGPLMSLADSQVLLLSLRQTRQHHLTSLLPIFPVPKPAPKSKSKSKAKQLITAAPGTTTNGGPITPKTPTTPTPTPTPTPEDSPWFPPFLLRALGGGHQPTSNIIVRVGPMTFEGVTLWECRFDERSLRAAGHPAVVKVGATAGVGVGAREDSQRKGMAASQVGRVANMPPPQIMRPNPTPTISQQPQQHQLRPSNPPPRPTSSPAPAIIHLVNLEASIHPWLATLIQRAARNLAGQDELKKLGQVVDILGRGKRLAPPVLGEAPVRDMPGTIRFVDGPPGSGPVSTLVSAGQGVGNGQGQVRPTNGLPGHRPPPIAVPPSQVRPLVLQQPPQTMIGSPRLYPHLQRPLASPTRPNTIMVRPAKPMVRPFPPTTLPPVPSPHLTRLPPPPQSQRPSSMTPPSQPIQIPYIPPLLICSFRENPSEKFVIPIELSYISYEADKDRLPMTTMTGKMKVSTFLPSKGWGKWTFPESAKPSNTPAPPAHAPIVDLTVSPTSGDILTKAVDGPDATSRKRKRTEHPLPLVSKAYTLGGVSIPPGPVQCVNIVFDGVGEKVWEVVKGLMKEVEGEKEEVTARKEGGDLVVDKATAEPAPADDKAGVLDTVEPGSESGRLSRPKRTTTRETSGSEAEVNGGDNVPQTGSRKAQIFNTLLKRVPKREFLGYQISSPAPKDYAIALGEPFGPVYRNVANKLPTDDFEDEVEVELEAPAKKKKKRALSPTVTFELPMSFEGVEEAIVAQTVPAKKVAAKKPIVARGAEGKACEGCGSHRKVWRIGPNGSGTLCFPCGEKFQAGTLSKNDLVGGLQRSDSAVDIEAEPMLEVITVRPAPVSTVDATTVPAPLEPEAIHPEGADRSMT